MKPDNISDARYERLCRAVCKALHQDPDRAWMIAGAPGKYWQRLDVQQHVVVFLALTEAMREVNGDG